MQMTKMSNSPALKQSVTIPSDLILAIFTEVSLIEQSLT